MLLFNVSSQELAQFIEEHKHEQFSLLVNAPGLTNDELRYNMGISRGLALVAEWLADKEDEFRDRTRRGM